MCIIQQPGLAAVDPPTEKAASSSSGLYTTTSGEMDVGTHYFYCSISTHCAEWDVRHGKRHKREQRDLKSF